MTTRHPFLPTHEIVDDSWKKQLLSLLLEYKEDTLVIDLIDNEFASEFYSLGSLLSDFHSNTLATETQTKDEEKSIRSQILDQKILLENVNLTRQVNSRLQTQHEKTDESSQTKLKNAERNDNLVQHELQRVVFSNEELKRQQRDIELVSNEIVNPEMEKITLQLDFMQQETLVCNNELMKTRTILNDLEDNISQSKNNTKDLKMILDDKKEEETKLLTKPMLIREEGKEKMKKCRILTDNLKDMEQILKKSRSDIKKVDIEILEEKHANELLNNTLSCHKSTMKKMKYDADAIEKDLELSKTKYHSFATTRLQFELDLREVKERYRHQKKTEAIQRKQMEQMKSLHTKKISISDNAREFVAQMNSKVSNTSRNVLNQEKLNIVQLQEIEGIKNALSVKLSRLMEQENIEHKVKETLTVMTNDVIEKEHEIEYMLIEEKKLFKIISILECQRDTQLRKIKTNINRKTEIIELIKFKKLIVMELVKNCAGINERIKEFNSLHDALKNEENEVFGATTASRIALKSMKEKVEGMQNELDNFQLESTEKSLILVKEFEVHNSSRINRAMLRREKTNARYLYREKKEEVDRQTIKRDKLKATASSLQRNRARLQTQNDRMSNSKNFMLEQLEERKNEIHQLLQRANTYEQVLKHGELNTQRRMEDSRALMLQCTEIQRYILVRKVTLLDPREVEKRIDKLQNELIEEMAVTGKLSNNLEEPSNCDRWIELNGKDVDEHQLIAKIRVLKERLNENKKHLLEKEVLLEELTRHTNELKRELDLCSCEIQPEVQNLNNYQSRVRTITRSMMALVSELSMYQATSLALEEEKENKQHALASTREMMAKVEPLSHDTIQYFRRLEDRQAKSIINSKERISFPYTSQFGRKFYNAKNALRTTAEPRPSAYIPDSGFGIPLPYSSKPFKPTASGVIHHIHLPVTDKSEQYHV